MTAAVVLNWNLSRMTLDCVASLRKQTVPIDHLIVVDNGSRADEAAVLADLPGSVTLVRLPTNVGFAGGMNAGIRAALDGRPAFVWLVNNDAFPEPGCLGRLLEAMAADPTLAVVAPKVVGGDGLEQPAGGQYCRVTGGNRFLDATAMATPVGAGGYWLTGTVPLVRADALARVGGFDERFFAYMEDLDLCLRLEAAGYRVRAVPDATAVHLSGASGGTSFGYYMYVRNHLWLVRKHAPAAVRTRLVLQTLGRSLDAAGCFARHGQRDKAQTAVEAVLAVVTRERGQPWWWGRAPRLAQLIARHPWQLARLCAWLGRPAGPDPGAEPA